jgi:hypothetical protein
MANLVRVKMLDSESDAHTGVMVHYLAGSEYDVPDRIARSWTSKGIAEIVEEAPGEARPASTARKRQRGSASDSTGEE